MSEESRRPPEPFLTPLRRSNPASRRRRRPRRIPHVMPFPNETVLAGLFDWLRTAHPFWNEAVERNEPRHIMVFSCDHGAGAALCFPSPREPPLSSCLASSQECFQPLSSPDVRQTGLIVAVPPHTQPAVASSLLAAPPRANSSVHLGERGVPR